MDVVEFNEVGIPRVGATGDFILVWAVARGRSKTYIVVKHSAPEHFLMLYATLQVIDSPDPLPHNNYSDNCRTP
jgi:hypothetical protein